MRNKPLNRLTTVEFTGQLSTACSRELIMEMHDKILSIMANVNENNAAELTNLHFMMQRLTAEARTWCRLYEQRTGQKIL